MKDEIPGAIPAEFRVPAVEPRVVRLPDGNVRMNGSSARFPETCPRCGGAPAETEVKLRLTPRFFKGNDGYAPAKGNEEMRSAMVKLFKSNNRAIKIPFCRRCGWLLKSVQYLPAILGTAFIVFVVPYLQLSHPKLFPWVSTGIAVAVMASVVDAVCRHLPKLFVNAGVEVVAMTKDSADLAFDDPMYAEKFVELNRLSGKVTSRPFAGRWSPAPQGSAQPNTAPGFRPLWRGSARRGSRS
jgi:hypothetical protein